MISKSFKKISVSLKLYYKNALNIYKMNLRVFWGYIKRFQIEKIISIILKIHECFETLYYDNFFV